MLVASATNVGFGSCSASWSIITAFKENGISVDCKANIVKTIAIVSDKAIEIAINCFCENTRLVSFNFSFFFLAICQLDSKVRLHE
jgi:hypothetical protein